MKIRCLTLILILLLSACGKEENDQPTKHSLNPVRNYNTWRLTGVENLNETIKARFLETHTELTTGDEVRVTLAPLSPDGTTAAASIEVYLDSGAEKPWFICSYTLDTADLPCYQIPADLPFDAEIESAVWSPDSQQFVFNENWAIFIQESDLWRFDVSSTTLTNLTDDHVIGGWFDIDPAVTPYGLDHAPMWHNKDLYFLRSSRATKDADFETALYRLKGAQGEPELIHKLPSDNPIGVVGLNFNYALSPDGQQIAFTYQSLREEDRAKIGVWLLDLKSGDFKQIAAETDFLVGAADYIKELITEQPGITVFTNLAWSKNRLIVYATYPVYEMHIPANFYSFTIDGSDIRPIFDTSSYKTEKEMYEVVSDAQTLRPHVGFVSPDGGSFFYVRGRLANDMPVSSVPITFDAALEDIGTVSAGGIVADRSRRGSNLFTISANGRVLVEDMLLTFE
ncbi:MAG TPA: hypothetical protein VHP83_27385 [Aggregatilineaceae bacterium]|nr:hypothetical protein [Aggregatilineaceae bacterium]